MSETRLARFTEWFRRRPNSIEFWEVFATDRRLVWCFVGESFSSLLLRADIGERGREELDGCTVEEAANHDERNFTVAIESLNRLEFTRGTRFRRARLEIAWTDDEPESITLYNTKSGDAQEGVLERLADDPNFEGIALNIEAPSSPFHRS